MSKKTFQIAIIGGGISSVTLAIGPHKRGIPTTIYEQAHVFGEIGAGVVFSPNAVHAMQLVEKCVYDAFEEVATHNLWESKSKVWFGFVDGTAGGPEALKILFSLEDIYGQNAVHRAHFLDAMLKYLPKDIAHFGKHLDDVVEDSETEKLVMKFHDGTTAETDGVIGCDGIKSQARKIIVGQNDPSALCVNTKKYAYRGMIPTPEAVKALGEEYAANAMLWVSQCHRGLFGRVTDFRQMGPNAHVLTFPVDHGATFNVFACTSTKDE